MSPSPRRGVNQTVIILGAAGRDFFNFDVVFRNNPRYHVACFTAAQIPDIAGRRYPPVLAGKRYPKGIPIFPEEQLPALVKRFRADVCVLAYSDLSAQDVLDKAAIVQAAGADFLLLGPQSTMLRSRKPVVAVTAVRTGCGKSETTRHVVSILRTLGKRAVAIRHPMPYGDLARQAVQRFAAPADLAKQHTTIEEREEYEPLIEMGAVVFAGVDYARILAAAEKEADVIVWDGGNNDIPFYRPDLWICIADPHRPGHERSYYPGQVNARAADVLIINKEKTAPAGSVERVRSSLRLLNPRATIVDADSIITLESPVSLRGKRVLVVEDGPTLTHGGMAYGAGTIAARSHGAIPVDPRPCLRGSLREVFARYPHLGAVLPAMGYGAAQIRELEQTINATPCDAVISGTPIDLRRVLKSKKPIVRTRYELLERGKPDLEGILAAFVRRKR
ncbi:MAG: GTPase [Candidatus Aenigmarchaeota archaeon]|nr:GTPase [Candidatus Aenigmarchaeota archaeon]